MSHAGHYFLRQQAQPQELRVQGLAARVRWCPGPVSSWLPAVCLLGRAPGPERPGEGSGNRGSPSLYFEASHGPLCGQAPQEGCGAFSPTRTSKAVELNPACSRPRKFAPCRCSWDRSRADQYQVPTWSGLRHPRARNLQSLQLAGRMVAIQMPVSRPL